ncbi:MAG: PLDc_N domain-containing protein [Chloroflexi bacterium]|nr:PLDc_N domain-containing protein [Chloroflexota bacterium]
MDQLREFIPLLIPLIVVQLILMTAALLDLAKRPSTRGPKWLWVLIIIFVNTIGPIIYFVLGREEA